MRSCTICEKQLQGGQQRCEGCKLLCKRCKVRKRFIGPRTSNSWCSYCMSDYNYKWRQANPEKAAQHRANRQAKAAIVREQAKQDIPLLRLASGLES